MLLQSELTFEDLCLREFRDDGPIVGRRGFDAEHRPDEALVDAAVLERNSPVPGRAHKGLVGEAAARGKRSNAKPAEAASEAGAQLLGREALQLLDGRRQRMDRVREFVAAALVPRVNVERLPLHPKLVRRKLDARRHHPAAAKAAQERVVGDEHGP
jgi:hypothetical protein